VDMNEAPLDIIKDRMVIVVDMNVTLDIIKDRMVVVVDMNVIDSAIVVEKTPQLYMDVYLDLAEYK